MAHALDQRVGLMYYQPTDKLAYCIAGRRVIFLDKVRGRYFALGQAADTAFKQMLASQGAVTPDHRSVLGHLLDQGYLRRTTKPASIALQADIEPATSDLVTLGSQPLRFNDVARAVALQLLVAGQLRWRPFSSVARERATMPIDETLDHSEVQREMARVAAAFARSSFFLGYTDRCLVRSIAMFLLCRTRGIGARLVIGVRSDPFVAHCWVQRAGVVLNDTAEHIRTFTPLLVLG